jgi:hypothetical protein
MSNPAAIGHVGVSLQALLEGELPAGVEVTLLAPDEVNGPTDPTLNLFLYKVQENATLRNMDWQPVRGHPDSLAPPPLSLNLHYLMTAYARNSETTGNSEAHKVLGEGMRVLYENRVVPDGYLAPELGDAQEQLKIMLQPVDMDELSRIWSTFQKPYRPSVLYEVAVVQLDMSEARARPMAKRVERTGVPRVLAPFHPPEIVAVTPNRGVAGTVVTFDGVHLVDWSATVTLDRAAILTHLRLSENRFTVTIPNGTAPGYYELRVDISRLFRKTFFFEVTP